MAVIIVQATIYKPAVCGLLHRGQNKQVSRAAWLAGQRPLMRYVTVTLWRMISGRTVERPSNRSRNAVVGLTGAQGLNSAGSRTSFLGIRHLGWEIRQNFAAQCHFQSPLIMTVTSRPMHLKLFHVSMWLLSFFLVIERCGDVHTLIVVRTRRLS